MLTLTTDFGLQDAYVGVMKGIIANINPQAIIIDLTHHIPPQNVLAARFSLLNSVPYFPKGTVHVAVIDPGVGSDRAGCAIEFSQGFLVGPNNGIFSGILSQFPPQKIVSLTNPQYWRTETTSSTFHGRDIFAPVAAHLAQGVPLEQLGNEMAKAELINVSFPAPQVTNSYLTGYIQYIDYFGNLITNISETEVKGKSWYVMVKNKQIMSGNTYSDCPPQELIAIIGSHGWVEIAMNQGNANSVLSLDYGQHLTIHFTVGANGGSPP